MFAFLQRLGFLVSVSMQNYVERVRTSECESVSVVCVRLICVSVERTGTLLTLSIIDILSGQRVKDLHVNLVNELQEPEIVPTVANNAISGSLESVYWTIIKSCFSTLSEKLEILYRTSIR